MPPVRRPIEEKNTSWSRETSGREARTWYSPMADAMTLAPRMAEGPKSMFTSALTESAVLRPFTLGAEAGDASLPAPPEVRRRARDERWRDGTPREDAPEVKRASGAKLDTASVAMVTRRQCVRIGK